jgi:hypothetical protein
MLGQVSIDAIHVTPDVVLTPAAAVMSGESNAPTRIHSGVAKRVEL